MVSRKPLSPIKVEKFVASLFADDLHAKRVQALATATSGVLRSAALGIHAIGRSVAAIRGTLDKHGVKQVDRLLGNMGIVVWDLFALWVPYVIAERREVFVNMDWTEFDADDHSMLVLSVQTTHGRSTPLLWKTVVKSKLRDKRNDHEDEVLVRLREVMPEGVKVTVVADRGFSDHKLYDFLKDELGFEYVIRFRSVVYVTSRTGEKRKAREWLGKGGRMRVLRKASVTARHCPVATVVCLQDKAMKDAWCIVASDPKATGRQLTRHYGKRFSCEEMFRDVKDLRYGMGMSWNRIGDPGRRDRMFLLAALAHGLLTLLGEAGERTGLDRYLKANTRKTRVLSLFRQGLRWYDLLPTMREEHARMIMTSFASVIAEHAVYRETFGAL